MRHRDFDKRIGAIRLPEATDIIGLDDDDGSADFERFKAERDLSLATNQTFYTDFYPYPRLQICSVNLKEGCYSFTFSPKLTTFFGPSFVGTMRIEKVGGGYRISADQYRVPRVFKLPNTKQIREINLSPEFKLDPVFTLPLRKKKPVYKRRHYFSYFKGTSAQLKSLKVRGQPCWFTLHFDEFRYNQPASGFDGSFDASPDRSVRFVLQTTSTPDEYTGTAYSGSSEIGKVSIKWLAPHLREATLQIHTLEGAEAPPSVTAAGGGVENFKTIFATAGWKLNVINSGTVPLPNALNGVQDPNDCWSKENSATLMASVPGYNPAELDNVWKARLLAIPAQLGCSRGRMFDNTTGDPNSVPREGAVTHSHDGYPASNSSNFGTAEDEQQKDVPRAFLRSAAHEVGHTFNQIHQNFESGNDNSIMTVTPSVANVLAGNGESFPDDIDLAFNETVQRHLKHLPDPAVRPGGMAFFGSAVTAPEADQVLELEELTLTAKAHSDTIRFGEPLTISWRLENTSEESLPVPDAFETDTLVMRVNVEDPDGQVRFIRPPNLNGCCMIGLQDLEPAKSVKGKATVFWGREGFAFTKPGRHAIEVIAMWDVAGTPVMASGRTTVWVAYPVTEKENQVAALLMDEHVGMAVALQSRKANDEAKRRIDAAEKLQKTHPACKRLKQLGV